MIFVQDSSQSVRLRPAVLDALARWGIVPREHTDPRRAYFLLKAIYCFEIREMKIRRREAERVLGPQPLDDYRRGLERLKEKYALLKMPAVEWRVDADGREDE